MHKDEMIRLRATGDYTLKEIAEAAGVSMKVVFTAVGRKGPPRTRRKQNVMRDDKIRAAVAGGVKQVTLAGIYKVTPGRISSIMREG